MNLKVTVTIKVTVLEIFDFLVTVTVTVFEKLLVTVTVTENMQPRKLRPLQLHAQSTSIFWSALTPAISAVSKGCARAPAIFEFSKK